jgi:hypothetical protein
MKIEKHKKQTEKIHSDVKILREVKRLFRNGEIKK